MGKYAIFLDGQKVHEQKNALSVAGKVVAMRTLIGYQSRFANRMVAGIGNSANVFDGKFITNKRLDAEVAYADVSSAFVDTSEAYSKLIFKASFPSENRYSIGELGLYSQRLGAANAGTTPNILLEFESSENITGATLITDKSLFSYKEAAIQIAQNSTATWQGSKNITKNSDNDEICFSYRKNGPTTFASSVTVTFFSGTSSISYAFNTDTSSTGRVSQSKKLSESSAGSFTTTNWSSIDKITIATGSHGPNNFIVADLLRFNEGIISSAYDSMLLSRVVLANTIDKRAGQSLDIEYYLSLGFNEAIS